MPYFGKKSSKNYKCKIIQLQVSKSELFWKKIKVTISRRYFFPRKKYSDFAQTSIIISLMKKKLPYLAVFRKTFLFGKYSNFNFQNRGYFGKKMFRKTFETSLIINFEIIKFARKIVLCKSFSIGKKSNYNFQNRGYFGKKNVPQISWNFGHN